MAAVGTGRCALYHRGSRLDQDRGGALRDLRADAERLGLRVVLRIVETGSGALNDRPGLLRVLEAARHRDVDAVIVWKLDRFGRSPLDVLSNIQKLTRRGVRFLVPSQDIDVRPGGDALSLLVLEMLAAVAEFERDRIRVRTRLGIARARARGARIGRPRMRNRPTPVAVLELRKRGLSWSAAARALHCSTTTLRRIASERPKPHSR
jgi:DNA invertase Pin-like site-specific DNA recombinase